MDEDWQDVRLGVRLDARGFQADVAAMRASLEGPLSEGAARAGAAVEGALLKAVRSGRLGFADLKQDAVSALDAVASAALKAGVGAVTGSVTGSVTGGGLASALAGVLAGGLPGRATGGPVTGGRPYLVGERGPELFVPTAAGRVETLGQAPARDVRVAITVNSGSDGGGGAPGALQRSARQVARAVRAALAE